MDEQHKIDHPKLKKVFNQLLDAIDNPDKGSLLFVCGPTGVGKTTLKEKTVETVLLNGKMLKVIFMSH